MITSNYIPYKYTRSFALASFLFNYQPLAIINALLTMILITAHCKDLSKTCTFAIQSTFFITDKILPITINVIENKVCMA